MISCLLFVGYDVLNAVDLFLSGVLMT